MQFSRRTVLAAIDTLENKMTQAGITAFLIELGSLVYKYIRDEQVSAKKRMNDLKQFIDRHPGLRIENETLENLVVEKAVGFFPPDKPAHPWSQPVHVSEPFQRLRYALEQDGFTVTDGKLLRSLPSEIGLPEKQSDLIRLLTVHQFATAKGHLEQALDAHARGNWASANGQIRTFWDALLDEAAERLDPSAATLGTGQPRRAKLASLGFLSVPLNEWSDDGKGFVNGFIRRLHPQGAHPGLSDEEDSTFRLHMVFLTAGLLMRRYDRGRK